MRKTMIWALAAAVLTLGSIVGQAHAQATRVADVIWAGGSIYSTILTPAGFVAPPEHSTDTLYDFGMSGLMGQRPVSDSAPGDRDYNGGRWSVTVAAFTTAGMAVLDSDNNGMIDEELTSAEDVADAVADGFVTLTETAIYFECPLLP